jgi:DNA replication and repair protein RecF
VRLDQLWLTDFRNYTSTSVVLAPEGLTVITGANGEGKTNLLEAVGWLATLSSFRGAPSEALVRVGASSAVVRGSGSRGGRELLIEGSINLRGRTRVQVNRQPLRRARDLLGALRVTVFSPDDLVLIKGGPAERRTFLDDLLVSCHPRWDSVRADLERVLRQRATLLKQAGGRLTTEVALTLDVWDAQLAEHGTTLASGRADLVQRLEPQVAKAYAELAGGPATVSLSYVAPWRDVGLASALAATRHDDLRRGVSTVGPHRDDLVITLSGLPSRTHASQGEQRTLALSLRLGGHSVVRETAEESPVLLLDDVFSELDPSRSAALLAHLPAGQALLTTAGPLPAGVTPAQRLEVRAGTVVPAAAATGGEMP